MLLRPIFAVALCCGPAACQGTTAGGDAGSDAILGQGAPPTAALVINEVAPRPIGEADWIEVYNRGSVAIDLCGVFVTDGLDRLDHYALLGGALPPAPCTPRWIEAGSYLVISADDSPGLDHAPFELGQSDEVHLVSTAGLALDSLAYFYAGGEGESLARVPSGEGLFFPVAPSPGEANPAERAP